MTLNLARPEISQMDTMTTKQLLTERAKAQVLGWFSMLGDYSLPERSHINDFRLHELKLSESARHNKPAPHNPR